MVEVPPETHVGRLTMPVIHNMHKLNAQLWNALLYTDETMEFAEGQG